MKDLRKFVRLADYERLRAALKRAIPFIPGEPDGGRGSDFYRLCVSLTSGDSSAPETRAPLPACDCDPDFGCKERDPTKFICQARKLERLARASDVASEAREPPYRIRSFWSPDKRHLVTACCSAENITVLDDNANIWEPTGPEADITAPRFTEETIETFRQSIDRARAELRNPLPDALKTPVRSTEPCSTFDDVLHEERNSKCIYCGAPMPFESNGESDSNG